MKLVECTQHADNNQFMLTSPKFIYYAIVSDEIIITITKYFGYQQIEFD